MPTFRERPYDVFISHAHADAALVTPIVHWLRDTAGFAVWHDERALEFGPSLAGQMESGIERARALLVMLSRNAQESSWVKHEIGAAIAEQRLHSDFRLLTLRLDDCTVPKFLNNMRWIDLPGGKLTFGTATEILLAMQHNDVDLDVSATRDVYGSMSWRDDGEGELADVICPLTAAAGLRVVGDSQDQRGFIGGDRVRTIMEGCGGLLAILPHRGEGNTSPYILTEMQIAKDLGLPILIFAEPEVVVPPVFDAPVIRLTRDRLRENSAALDAIRSGVRQLQDRWRPPRPHHFTFFAPDFDEARRETVQTLRRTIQRTLGVPCLVGEEFRDGEVQNQIAARIREALLVICDISGTNLNTCIETGIAIGGGRRVLLFKQGPRTSQGLPFMFRNRQVWFYDDDIHFAAVLRKAIYPFRRAVIAAPHP